MKNQFKEQHLERKKNIIQCLLNAESFLTEHGYSEESNRIAAQRHNLEEGEFSISVVGEFSAGKSTFLNALMRKKILPSFTKETTATINFLRHKTKAQNDESGCVYYNDGHAETFQTADLKTISRYVSTDSDSVDVAKSVKYLDLFLDSRFLEGNVTLVDTPGLNGIAEGHRELTQEQIEKSSAGIFLFDANKPGSHSDFEFLGELQKRIKNVLFVLNKIDNIKESEGETVESVVEKLKENYKTVFPDAITIPEIWPVAAYPALVARSNTKLEFRGKTEFTPEERQEFEKISRMEEFEDRLWRFLTQGEKTKQELLSPVVHLIQQLSSIQESNNMELSVLDGSVDQAKIEEKQLEIEQALENLNEILKQETKEVKNKIREAESEFENSVKEECSEIENWASRKLDNFTSIDEISPEKLERDVKNRLVYSISGAYDTFLENLREIVEIRTTEMLDLISSGLSETIPVNLNQKLELTNLEIGLDDYEKQQDALQQEIDKLSMEVKEAEDNKWKQDEIARKRKKKEEALESLRTRRDTYQELSASRTPTIQTVSYEDYEEVDPTGLFGHLKRVFVGATYRPVQKVKTDTTEYDRYQSEKKAVLENYDVQIQKAEEELGALEPEQQLEAERLLSRKNELLRQKRAEKERRDEAFAKKVKELSEKQLSKQKDEITEFVQELCRECLNSTSKEFRKERENRIKTVVELIAGRITNQIRMKQEELKNLQDQNQQVVEQRDKRISTIEEENQQIQELLLRATGLQAEIEDIHTDTITQEEL